MTASEAIKSVRVSRDQATLLIQRLLRLPNEARSYGCSEEQAAQNFGIDRGGADALVALVAKGSFGCAQPQRSTRTQRLMISTSAKSSLT